VRVLNASSAEKLAEGGTWLSHRAIPETDLPLHTDREERPALAWLKGEGVNAEAMTD